MISAITAWIFLLGWWVVALINLLWVLFVFATAVDRAHVDGKMTWYLWLLAITPGGIGWLIDVGLNHSLFILIWWEFPRWSLREWTISRRAERLIRGTGYRVTVASVVKVLTDPFDRTGVHIN